MTTVAIWYVIRYANKVKRDPHASPVYDLDRTREDTDPRGSAAESFTQVHKTVMSVVLLAFVGLVVGTLRFGWYITEIAGLFLAVGVVTCIAGRLKLHEAASSFVSGAKEMMTAALVVAFSRGILVVASEGKSLTLSFPISPE